MDPRVKDLLKELGSAINEAVSRSSRVEFVMQAIREAGYEVYLSLDANIAVESNRNSTETDGFTDDDRSFLRRLRIEC